MKITIYTTTNCQFSKQEKEYLTSHELQFEEKNLDTNKAFLTEMMTVGNNFAGTPVTKIEKDDGTVTVLKGFTPEEFNTALGFAEPEPVPPAATTAPSQGTTTPDVSVPDVPAAPTPVEPPVTPPAPTQDAPINDVLNKLETNMNNPANAQPAPVQEPPIAPPAPVMPPPPAPDTPAIPDFSADSAPQPVK